jgi:hypothetical protein
MVYNTVFAGSDQPSYTLVGDFFKALVSMLVGIEIR